MIACLQPNLTPFLVITVIFANLMKFPSGWTWLWSLCSCNKGGSNPNSERLLCKNDEISRIISFLPSYRDTFHLMKVRQHKEIEYASGAINLKYGNFKSSKFMNLLLFFSFTSAVLLGLVHMEFQHCAPRKPGISASVDISKFTIPLHFKSWKIQGNRQKKEQIKREK